MQWDGEQDDVLRQSRQNGESFGWIWAKFKQRGWLRSKNSLIGRAARMALPAPEKPTHALDRHKPKTLAPRVPKRTLTPRDAATALARLRSGPASARSNPRSTTNATDVDAGAFLGIALVDLGQEHCRYPDGDPVLFCGQPPMKGSPYCVKHHRICFIHGRS